MHHNILIQNTPQDNNFRISTCDMTYPSSATTA